MPRPNFYMSKNDRRLLLDVISNYLGMWADADPDVIADRQDEFEEIHKVEKKIMNMHKSKGYENALIKDALDIANKKLAEKSKSDSR